MLTRTGPAIEARKAVMLHRCLYYYKAVSSGANARASICGTIGSHHTTFSHDDQFFMQDDRLTRYRGHMHAVHEDVFGTADELETNLSFQDDTWASVQKVLAHDADTDTDYDQSIRDIEERDLPLPIDEEVFDCIEGGYQYDWEEDTIEVDRPVSRYGLFTVRLEPSGGFVLLRTPFVVSHGVVSLNLVLGTPESLKRWVKIQARRGREEAELKPGTFRANARDGRLQLEELEDLTRIDPIHPKREDLFEQIEYFFNHSEQFTRMGQKGTQKILLAGPPGTGKTTLAQKVARTYEDDMAVAFCTDVSAMSKVQAKAAHTDQPAIIVVEDAEQAFNVDPTAPNPGGGATSDILQFLDGVDLPQNENGCMILMTSNHPQEIEDRILKRPGRIDYIMRVGFLEGEDAARCANLYLPDDHDLNIQSLAALFDRCSGDEIRQICDAAIQLAVRDETDITMEVLEEARTQLEDRLNTAEEMADQSSALNGAKETVGF